jgi:hypothetical protein
VAGFAQVRFRSLPKGDGLRTEAHFRFSNPMNWTLEPWRVPTNTIRDPLISFTAMRGCGPWLKTQEWFQKFGLSSVPNQVSAWGQSDTSFQIQLAVPVENATNEMQRLAANWMTQANSNIVKAPLDPLRFHTNVAQISTRMLLLIPFIRAAPEPMANFERRRFPDSTGDELSTAELFEQLNRTNLVYYDWEHSVAPWSVAGNADVLGTLDVLR